MTSASQVVAALAVPLVATLEPLEAVGILLYVVATALLLRLAVRWARDAIGPPAGTGGSTTRRSGQDIP